MYGAESKKPAAALIGLGLIGAAQILAAAIRELKPFWFNNATAPPTPVIPSLFPVPAWPPDATWPNPTTVPRTPSSTVNAG
jgi:hypothetical protein